MSLQPVPDAQDPFSLTVVYQPSDLFWLTDEGLAALNHDEDVERRRALARQLVSEQQPRQRRRTRGLLRQVVGDGPERHHKPGAELGASPNPPPTLEAQPRADTQPHEVSR